MMSLDPVTHHPGLPAPSSRYKLTLLKPTVKALMSSTKVSIRADNRGFLSLQYMIRNEDGQICFVEYYVSSRKACESPLDTT